MSGCVTRVDGSAPGGGSSSWEVDFSAEPNQVIATGPISIAGQTWTAQAVAGQTFELVNGTGLVYDINGSATNTSFNGTASSAAYIEIPLSTVYSILATDLTATLRIEAYYPTLDVLTNSPYTLIGIWGPSGVPNVGAPIRLTAATRTAAAGVQGFMGRWTSNGASPNFPGTPNVLGVMVRSSDYGCAIGTTWGGAWPTAFAQHCNLNLNADIPLTDTSNRLVLAFATDSAAGQMSAVCERLRVSAWRFEP